MFFMIAASVTEAMIMRNFKLVYIYCGIGVSGGGGGGGENILCKQF